MPEVKRIKKHTHVPRAVLGAARVKETVEGTQRKKEKRKRAHSAAGSVPKVHPKKKKVWKVAE